MGTDMGKPNNDDIETRANLILEYMKANRRFCTKEELQQVIQCGERIVRDCINWLRNHRKMIVSVSSQKGYKLIIKGYETEQDMEYVKQMWMEIDSRIEELENVRAICRRCWDYYQSKKPIDIVISTHNTNPQNNELEKGEE